MRSMIVQSLMLVVLLLSPSSLEAREHLVSVEGHAMRVWSEGLEKRGQGQPVMVFENGSAAGLESWSDFREKAARLGPVLFYDRSTVGGSQWDGEIGTPVHVTARLWALLSKLNVAPPYIIIGWSWGADLAIQHARSHPDEVSGIVLIDPPLHSGVAEIEILEAIGVDPSAHQQTIARMRKELGGAPDRIRADVAPILSIFEKRREPDLRLPADIAVAGFVAGARPEPPAHAIAQFGPLPYDFQTHLAAKTRHRTRRLAQMVFASHNGALVVLPQESHALHRARPELILDAIDHMMRDPKPR